MPNRVLSGPADDQTSILRQLKILVIVLILSNIGLGIFGFYFLRTIDRKYSTLIALAVPTLNDMQTLTMFIGDAMRSTNPTLFGDNPQSRAEMSQRAHTALERDRDLRNSILKREWLPRDAEERLNFQNAGDAFSRTAAEVVGLFESGESAEASRQREQSLRPAFNRYVTATTKAADVLEDESLRTSDILTASTVSTSKIMLGLASWPVIILCGFLLITALFVIGVLLKVLFSGREAV
jgi:hypothetical protein